MSIEKHPHPGWYYVKSYPNGRKGNPHRDKVESYDEAVALNNLLMQHKAAPPTHAPTHPRMIDIVEAYLLWAKGKLAPTTYATRERRLTHYVMPHFGKYRVKDLKQTIFDTYEPTVAEWTYHTDFNAIMAMISWMIKRGYAEPLTWRPERPKGNHKVKPVPHPTDILAAIAGMKKKSHRMLFSMMLFTGLRWNEAKNLRWEDVDLLVGTIRVKEIIDGPQDVIYIPEPLRPWLKEQQKETGLIWESRNGQPYATLEKVLQDAGKSIGVHITSHTFRHASATYLYEQTNDLYQVQAHLRHKKISTTQIYARMSIARRRSSVNSVIDYMSQKTISE